MVVDAYGDIGKRERSILGNRREQEFTIVVAIPKQSTLRETHLLFATNLFALGKIRLVEEEVDGGVAL